MTGKGGSRWEKGRSQYQEEKDIIRCNASVPVCDSDVRMMSSNGRFNVQVMTIDGTQIFCCFSPLSAFAAPLALGEEIDESSS
jgi:hypothetical protein